MTPSSRRPSTFHILILLAIVSPECRCFQISPRSHRHRVTSLSSTSTTVGPSQDTTVGVVGRGFVSILTAKICALAGYDTWMVTPPGDDDSIATLIQEDSCIPTNLQFVPSSDTAMLESKLPNTGAIIFAVDDDSTMQPDVISYLLSPDKAPKLKRVVGMSRHLNGNGYGFFTKASKISANKEVWHNDAKLVKAYKEYEDVIKQTAKDCGASYTIARAGTLKGGGCGEFQEYPQFLTNKFYEITKKDIVKWQFLFDCAARGVVLQKGDTFTGPGAKAVFTANAGVACIGDTPRAGIAEAMVRSLMEEGAANVDFGIGAEEQRDPPTDEEWKTLFALL